MTTLTVLGMFAVLLVLGVPVVASTLIAPLFVLVFVTDVPLVVFFQAVIAASSNFELLAILFFILAAELVDTMGMTLRISRFASVLTGGLRGGLMQLNIVTSIIFVGFRARQSAMWRRPRAADISYAQGPLRPEACGRSGSGVQHHRSSDLALGRRYRLRYHCRNLCRAYVARWRRIAATAVRHADCGRLQDGAARHSQIPGSVKAAQGDRQRRRRSPQLVQRTARQALESQGVTFIDVDRTPFVARIAERNRAWEAEGYWRNGSGR